MTTTHRHGLPVMPLFVVLLVKEIQNIANVRRYAPGILPGVAFSIF
jgi:hypothetical protein